MGYQLSFLFEYIIRGITNRITDKQITKAASKTDVVIIVANIAKAILKTRTLAIIHAHKFPSFPIL